MFQNSLKIIPLSDYERIPRVTEIGNGDDNNNNNNNNNDDDDDDDDSGSDESETETILFNSSNGPNKDRKRWKLNPVFGLARKANHTVQLTTMPSPLRSMLCHQKLRPIRLLTVIMTFLLFFVIQQHHNHNNQNNNNNHHWYQWRRQPDSRFDINNQTLLDELLSASANNNSLSDMKQQSANSSFHLCPLIPPNLVGHLKVLTSPLKRLEDIERMYPELEAGGRFRPRSCRSRHRVAIIVPYRNRFEHLKIFLTNMHPMLMRQNLDYGIYVVEQFGTDAFNRAKLMNVGYLEALKQYHYDCFVFHDVDLIPEDDRNLYTCPQQPRHMSVAIDKFHYRLPYVDIFGGVGALTTDQFRKVNGFSNQFWGWGGEDDDMSNRIRHYGYNITRYPAEIARYKMLKHSSTTPNAERFRQLYSGWKRFKTDGINTIRYEVKDLQFKKLYTWIYVELFAPAKVTKKLSQKKVNKFSSLFG